MEELVRNTEMDKSGYYSKLQNKSRVNLFNYLITPYLFFLLFGPKIGLYFDTSIIASLFTVIIVLSQKKNIVFYKNYFSYVVGILIILMYSFFMMLLNDNILVVLVGRYLRSIISLISIWTIFAASKKSNEAIIYSLIKVLAIHAFLVIVTAFNLELQHMLSLFTGFDKKIRPLRSTGLMIGFDMAGLLCVLGYILSSAFPYKTTKKINLRIMMILFMGGTLVTSRFSILILLVILFLFIIKNRKNKNKKFEVRLGIIFISIIAVPVLLLFLATTSIGGNLQNTLSNYFPHFNSVVNGFMDSYADTNIESTFLNHFNFDGLSLTNIIFGIAANVNQDPGYTTTIYSIGIIGLTLSMIWYLKVFVDTFRVKNQLIKQKYNFREINYINQIIVIMILITFGLSIKNNYFFTGTYFEILVIFISLLYRKITKERCSNET